MKRHLIIYSLITAACTFVMTACVKEKQEPGFDTGNLAPLSIEFDNIVGGQNLMLGTGHYQTAGGATYTITQLQYYISNITLTKADGTKYVVPQDSSYFLIREGESHANRAIVNVPEGDYSRISFIVGVDSLRSTMDISRRTGVLDPTGTESEGMYWGWNSGYIFFKMEGISAAAPADPTGQHKFRYHIGGFGGYDVPSINNIKKITLDLSERGVAKPRRGRKSNIHLMVDIDQVLNGLHPILIAEHPTVMFSEFSQVIADNFPGMFRHDHTEN